jgi:hypothetical protein
VLLRGFGLQQRAVNGAPDASQLVGNAECWVTSIATTIPTPDAPPATHDLHVIPLRQSRLPALVGLGLANR